MSKGNDQAFPTPGTGWNTDEGFDWRSPVAGMTKREVIAKDVMASMLGAFAQGGNPHYTIETAAKQAVKAADALLEALQ